MNRDGERHLEPNGARWSKLRRNLYNIRLLRNVKFNMRYTCNGFFTWLGGLFIVTQKHVENMRIFGGKHAKNASQNRGKPFNALRGGGATYYGSTQIDACGSFPEADVALGVEYAITLVKQPFCLRKHKKGRNENPQRGKEKPVESGRRHHGKYVETLCKELVKA